MLENVPGVIFPYLSYQGSFNINFPLCLVCLFSAVIIIVINLDFLLFCISFIRFNFILIVSVSLILIHMTKIMVMLTIIMMILSRL